MKTFKKRHNSVIAAVKFNSRARAKCVARPHDISKPMPAWNYNLQGNGSYRQNNSVCTVIN